MASNAEVISTLNGLIETCRDGQEGFRTAAEGVRGAELRELFGRYSQQRAAFAGELQTEVRRLGGDPENTGSLVASLHRGWMGLRAALEGGDERAIVSECERGEGVALEAYRDALGTDMPANVRATVERQFAEIKEARNLIGNLGKGSGA
ncbi:MAG: PA2169 family four-helix-bundle protein [Acidobacteria bacterium]|nr:PA2169 family four-helix-bundle protein [Acidobacteriota bacterium]